MYKKKFFFFCVFLITIMPYFYLIPWYINMSDMEYLSILLGWHSLIYGFEDIYD